MISMGRKVLSVAVASTLLWASGAGATGMGKLTVLSSLGQPLRAEIEITSPNREEISTLAPKLASADAFRQANIDFNPALQSLRFNVEPRGNGYVIKVTSSQAMNEPFVDMLLEVTASNSKILREYTFLLDPAELRNSQSPQVANPSPVAGSSVVSTRSQPAAEATAAPVQTQPAGQPAGRNAVQSAPASSKTVAATEYKVKQGDTLGKIANQYRSEGLSLDEVLVSLYKSNPDAFVGKNMNRLKAGQILAVPNAAEMHAQAGSAGAARAVVVAHAADFNAYRNKLADIVEHSSARKSAATGQSAGGNVSAKVKEVPTGTSESPDKLKLSKSEAAKTGSGKGAAEEDKLAKDRAVADANSRVKELEKNVNDLQKLLEVKNKDMAAKQADSKEKPKAEEKPAAASPASATAAASAAAPAPASAAAAASEPVSASASASASAADAAAASAASAVKPKRKAVAPPPPPPEVSFFDGLPDWLLPGAAVLLAGVAGAGIWSRYRKKKLQHFEDSILTGSSMKANSMFGSTGGQSVDTNNSVFNSNFAPSASQLDANEVDPVAEADVYIAYGRDTQAEEILKEALRTQPERQAVRLKLLEIYFARKDARQYERLASELYGMTNGSGEEWAQAASMGIALEPNNPLYAGGQVKAEFATASFGSPTQPLEDLDPDALLANSLSRDMLDAISVIDTATGSATDVAADNPAAAISEPQPAAQAKADDGNMLDFDLGLGDQVPVVPEEKPAPVPPVEEPVPAMDFGTIDFDFGGDQASAQPAAAEPQLHELIEQLPQDPEPVVDLHEELSLDLGVENPAADAVHDLSFDMSPDMSPDISSGSEAGLSLDVPELNLAGAEPVMADEQELDAAAEPALADPASAFEFDLSGIDLDLPSDLAADLPATATEPASAPEPDNAEMATKLDLAVAYHEIGDKEGARELLDEVLRGGSAAQKERAQTMLNQLV